jgi:hypothetical protein
MAVIIMGKVAMDTVVVAITVAIILVIIQTMKSTQRVK